MSLVSTLLLGILCLQGSLPSKASPLLQDKLLGKTPISLKEMTVHHSLEGKVPLRIAFFSKKIRHLLHMHSCKSTSKQMGSFLGHLLRAVANEQRTCHPKLSPGRRCPCTQSICRWGRASRACCTLAVSTNLNQLTGFVTGKQTLMLLISGCGISEKPLLETGCNPG